MKHQIFHILAAALLAGPASAAELLLDEKFQDSDRSNLEPTNSASWFNSQHINSIKIVGEKLRWFPNHQHQTVVAYFQPLEPQRALAVGETLTASFEIMFPNPIANAVDGLRAGLFVSGGQRVEADEFGAEFPGAHGGVFFATDVGLEAVHSRIMARNGQAGPALVGSLGKDSVYRIIKGGLPSKALENGVTYTCRLTVERKSEDIVEFSFGMFDGATQIYGSATDVPVADILPSSDAKLVFDTLGLGRVGGPEGFNEAFISNVTITIDPAD